MKKEEIMHILLAEKMSPQKSKGQNFLIDDDVARKITSFVDVDEHVLEVGPGLGALTKHLVSKAKSLTAVEIDRGYARYIEKTYPNTQLYVGDFLKYLVPRETTTVISNIPYYITTKIIEKVVIKTENLKRFVFMVESAVKERLTAKPSTKEYGPLAILIALTGTLTEKMTVTPDKFYPVPHVNSTVFIFDMQPHKIDLDSFYTFVRSAFLNRRKTLLKNLRANYAEERIKHAFSLLGIDPLTRIEALTPQTILDLYLLLLKTPTKSE